MKNFAESECLVPITEGIHIELQPLKDHEGGKRITAGGVDMSSMDSTDTFASCNTHPFNSEADLTGEDPERPPGVRNKDPTLYVNPLDDTGDDYPTSRTPTPRSSPRHRPKPLAYTTDVFDDTRSTDNLLGSSRSSLQESPLPKHRRARFQEGTPKPFSRLLESVERARTKEITEKNRQTTSSKAAGRTNSKSSLEEESHRQKSPERKKSILKHRDPEFEQLLPDLSEKPKKPRALPVKFVGLDDKDDSCSRPRRVLPRSPMPIGGRERAPLADLLADFSEQEKAARDELTPENLLKDSLEPVSTEQHSMIILRCSRSDCTLNKPITPDTATHWPSTMCVCGATMTNIDIPPIGDNISPSVHNENRIPTEELNNGPANTSEIGDLLYADQNSPSEETQLLTDSPTLKKGSKLS